MDEHDSPELRPRGAPASAGGPVVAGRYRVERLIDQRVVAALTALDGSAVGPTTRRALGDLAVTATNRLA